MGGDEAGKPTGGGAKNQLAGVLEQLGDTDGSDQDRQPGALSERLVGEAFDQDAEKRTR